MRTSSLSGVVKSTNFKYCFGCLDLTEEPDLSDKDLQRKTDSKNLRLIDISNQQKITSLRDLSVNNLVEIKANNLPMISELLDFDLPKDNYLQRLEMKDCSCSSIRIHDNFRFLSSINLAGNGLTSQDLKVFSKMKELTHLNLSRNKLEALDVGMISKLEWLDASNNQITRILSLPSSLENANVDNNEITSLEAFIQAVNLQTLSAVNNKIAKKECIQSLTELKNLESLNIQKNPFNDTEYLLHILPDLFGLNGTKLTAEMKIQANERFLRRDSQTP